MAWFHLKQNPVSLIATAQLVSSMVAALQAAVGACHPPDW